MIPLDEINSPKAIDGLQAIRDIYGNGHLKASNQSSMKSSPPSKRYKLENNRSIGDIVVNGTSEQVTLVHKSTFTTDSMIYFWI